MGVSQKNKGHKPGRNAGIGRRHRFKRAPSPAATAPPEDAASGGGVATLRSARATARVHLALVCVRCGARVNGRPLPLGAVAAGGGSDAAPSEATPHTLRGMVIYYDCL